MRFLQIAVSIATHAQDLPELTHSARWEETPGANKEAIITKWQEWLQAAGVLWPKLTAAAACQDCHV